MLPLPTSLLPSQAYRAPFAARHGTPGSPHRRVLLLPRRPRVPALEVIDQRKNLLRGRLDARRALNAEGVGLGGRKDENAGDQHGDDDDDFLDHEFFLSGVVGPGCGQLPIFRIAC